MHALRLLAIGVLIATAGALVHPASATPNCVTVGVNGVCIDSYTQYVPNPGVYGTGGPACFNTYCPWVFGGSGTPVNNIPCVYMEGYFRPVNTCSPIYIHG